MRDKKITFPRPALKSLAEDLSKLVYSNEGCLHALEIVEEIPHELRSAVMDGLSSFYWQDMATFFQLVQLEYGREMEKTIGRILTKYQMAGLNTESLTLMEGCFYGAFASCTRHTGRMSLDIAWNTGGRGLYVESYFLSFGPDGLHSVFVIEDMPALEFERERSLLAEMVELTFEECCFLLQDAYAFNTRCMSRPALGRFLYQKYLDIQVDLQESQVQKLMHRLSIRLTPRQLVNSLFYGLKVQDYKYLLALVTKSCLSEGRIFYQMDQGLPPGSMLLEGQVESIHGSYDQVTVKAYSLSLYEREVYRCDYTFELLRDEYFGWLIQAIERNDCGILASDSDSNPFNLPVLCRVYEIVDLDELFDILDVLENIREVEELPYGLHMRVTSYEEDLNHGISFLDGVLADLVINGEEFVIISQEAENLDAFEELFASQYDGPLAFQAEYEVPVASAYHYLSGQCSVFEDILLDDEHVFYEDGMRFLTARYVVKDREAVIKRLQQLSSLQLNLPDELSVYYQTEGNEEDPRFLAEYMLDMNWVTLSAFGDRDMSIVRQDFEEDMYEAMEFDGLEIREDGMFEILTMDVKRQYPQLEAHLKRMYLNKWYYTRMSPLSGMSPSEAVETEEGKRLLWAMFKQIRQQEKKYFREGIPRRIALKEYWHRVNMKKDCKQ